MLQQPVGYTQSLGKDFRGVPGPGFPAVPDHVRWHLAVDTFLPTPQDLLEEGAEVALQDPATYRVGPQSSAILVAYPVTLDRLEKHRGESLDS